MTPTPLVEQIHVDEPQPHDEHAGQEDVVADRKCSQVVRRRELPEFGGEEHEHRQAISDGSEVHDHRGEVELELFDATQGADSCRVLGFVERILVHGFSVGVLALHESVSFIHVRLDAYKGSTCGAYAC